jgi:hypothetical protein
MAKLPKLPRVEDDLCDTHESEMGKLLARSCSIVRSIQWVARNLENKRVLMMDAPSAEAWGMLQSYRESGLRKNEFWDGVFVKLIPSRAQLDEKPEDHVDGEGIMKTCDRLLGIRAGAQAKVRGESGQPEEPDAAVVVAGVMPVELEREELEHVAAIQGVGGVD